MYRTREEARLATRRISRRWPLISGIIAAVLVAVLGLLVWLRQGPFSVDTEWAVEVREDPTGFLDIVSNVMNQLGGGPVAVWVIPLLGVAALLIVKRPFAALYWLLAIAASAGVVQLVKHLIAGNDPRTCSSRATSARSRRVTRRTPRR